MPYSEIDSPVLMLTCGPVTAYPQVLSGLSRPVIYDYDPAFQRFFEIGSIPVRMILLYIFSRYYRCNRLFPYFGSPAFV